MPETERTRVMPGMPFIEVSSGKVTNCSTSSGANPSASAISVTVGLFRSGNTSTGTSRGPTEPETTTTAAAARTKIRLRRLALTRKLNMTARPDLVEETDAVGHDPILGVDSRQY